MQDRPTNSHGDDSYRMIKGQDQSDNPVCSSDSLSPSEDPRQTNATIVSPEVPAKTWSKNLGMEALAEVAGSALAILQSDAEKKATESTLAVQEAGVLMESIPKNTISTDIENSEENPSSTPIAMTSVESESTGNTTSGSVSTVYTSMPESLIRLSWVHASETLTSPSCVATTSVGQTTNVTSVEDAQETAGSQIILKAAEIANINESTVQNAPALSESGISFNENFHDSLPLDTSALLHNLNMDTVDSLQQLLNSVEDADFRTPEKLPKNSRNSDSHSPSMMHPQVTLQQQTFSSAANENVEDVVYPYLSHSLQLPQQQTSVLNTPPNPQLQTPQLHTPPRKSSEMLHQLQNTNASRLQEIQLHNSANLQSGDCPLYYSVSNASTYSYVTTNSTYSGIQTVANVPEASSQTASQSSLRNSYMCSTPIMASNPRPSYVQYPSNMSLPRGLSRVGLPNIPLLPDPNTQFDVNITMVHGNEGSTNTCVVEKVKLMPKEYVNALQKNVSIYWPDFSAYPEKCCCVDWMEFKEVPVEHLWIHDSQLYKLPQICVIVIALQELVGIERYVDQQGVKVYVSVGQIFLHLLPEQKKTIENYLVSKTCDRCFLSLEEMAYLQQRKCININSATMISLGTLREMCKTLMQENSFIDSPNLNLYEAAHGTYYRKILNKHTRCPNCAGKRKYQTSVDEYEEFDNPITVVNMKEKEAYETLLEKRSTERRRSLEKNVVRKTEANSSSLKEIQIGSAIVGNAHFNVFILEGKLFFSIRQLVLFKIFNINNLKRRLVELKYKPRPAPTTVDLYFISENINVDNTLWIDEETVRCICCMKHSSSKNICEGFHNLKLKQYTVDIDETIQGPDDVSWEGVVYTLNPHTFKIAMKKELNAKIVPLPPKRFKDEERNIPRNLRYKSRKKKEDLRTTNKTVNELLKEAGGSRRENVVAQTIEGEIISLNPSKLKPGCYVLKDRDSIRKLLNSAGNCDQQSKKTNTRASSTDKSLPKVTTEESFDIFRTVRNTSRRNSQEKKKTTFHVMQENAHKVKFVIKSGKRPEYGHKKEQKPKKGEMPVDDCSENSGNLEENFSAELISKEEHGHRDRTLLPVVSTSNNWVSEDLSKGNRNENREKFSSDCSNASRQEFTSIDHSNYIKQQSSNITNDFNRMQQSSICTDDFDRLQLSSNANEFVKKQTSSSTDDFSRSCQSSDGTSDSCRQQTSNDTSDGFIQHSLSGTSTRRTRQQQSSFEPGNRCGQQSSDEIISSSSSIANSSSSVFGTTDAILEKLEEPKSIDKQSNDDMDCDNDIEDNFSDSSEGQLASSKSSSFQNFVPSQDSIGILSREQSSEVNLRNDAVAMETVVNDLGITEKGESDNEEHMTSSREKSEDKEDNEKMNCERNQKMSCPFERSSSEGRRTIRRSTRLEKNLNEGKKSDTNESGGNVSCLGHRKDAIEQSSEQKQMLSSEVQYEEQEAENSALDKAEVLEKETTYWAEHVEDNEGEEMKTPEDFEERNVAAISEVFQNHNQNDMADCEEEVDFEYYLNNVDEGMALVMSVLEVLDEIVDYNGNLDEGFDIKNLKLTTLAQQYFPGILDGEEEKNILKIVGDAVRKVYELRQIPEAHVSAHDTVTHPKGNNSINGQNGDVDNVNSRITHAKRKVSSELSDQGNSVGNGSTPPMSQDYLDSLGLMESSKLSEVCKNKTNKRGKFMLRPFSPEHLYIDGVSDLCRRTREKTRKMKISSRLRDQGRSIIYGKLKSRKEMKKCMYSQKNKIRVGFSFQKLKNLKMIDRTCGRLKRSAKSQGILKRMQSESRNPNENLKLSESKIFNKTLRIGTSNKKIITPRRRSNSPKKRDISPAKRKNSPKKKNSSSNVRGDSLNKQPSGTSTKEDARPNKGNFGTKKIDKKKQGQSLNKVTSSYSKRNINPKKSNNDKYKKDKSASKERNDLIKKDGKFSKRSISHEKNQNHELSTVQKGKGKLKESGKNLKTGIKKMVQKSANVDGTFSTEDCSSDISMDDKQSEVIEMYYTDEDLIETDGYLEISDEDVTFRKVQEQTSGHGVKRKREIISAKEAKRRRLLGSSASKNCS